MMSAVSAWSRTISGKVYSDADSTAIAGAACKLMSGGAVIEGTVSDTDGKFKLNAKYSGAVSLEISQPGYRTTEIKIESGGNVDAGIVYLIDSNVLNELTVTAETVTYSRGQTIVFPGSEEKKASSSSISLFQKLPLDGLQADEINRSITVDGGAPVILINGIPSEMADLNAIRPDDIEKIEYSRIAPARYSDKGNSGFINVVVKKRNDGGQVYIWGRSAVTTAFVDAEVRTSYHQGPSQFSLLYNPSWRNYQRVYNKIDESYIGDDFRVDLKEQSRNPFNYYYHNIRLRYDYSPSFDKLFSVTFNIRPFFNTNRKLGHSLDSYQDGYDIFNRQHSKDMAPALDLFYKRQLNDRNTLEVQMTGTLSYSDFRRTNQYIFGNGSVDEYSNDADSRRQSLISEISYIHDFNDKTSLSAGYQNTVSHSVNTYLTTDYRPELDENNNYVYAQLRRSMGPVFVSVASGVKLFWIKNDRNKRNFIRNLSSVNATWKMAKGWNLAASFQYSPIIPSLSSLTDYPQQITPYLITNGNPDLKAVERFNYRLTPTYNYKKFRASLQLSYSHINDFETSNVVYLGNKLFLLQSVNARRAWDASGYLNLSVRNVAGFGANLGMGITRSGTDGDDWRHRLTSFNANINLWWNHGPFTISYWRKLPGKYLNGQEVRKDENGDSFSFSYKPDKHWVLNASWMYMFEKNGTSYPMWDYSKANPIVRSRHIRDNANMVVLSVTYSADFGSIFRSMKRSLNNSDESSSLLKN